MNKARATIRQGDVVLFPVSKLPNGCKEVPNEKGRIVLAHGEVTGHAHAIAVQECINVLEEIKDDDRNQNSDRTSARGSAQPNVQRGAAGSGEASAPGDGTSAGSNGLAGDQKEGRTVNDGWTGTNQVHDVSGDGSVVSTQGDSISNLKKFMAELGTALSRIGVDVGQVNKHMSKQAEEIVTTNQGVDHE